MKLYLMYKEEFVMFDGRKYEILHQALKIYKTACSKV
jgi:hypothetical protein